MARTSRETEAYRRIDLDDYTKPQQQVILEDAAGGGGEFGIVMVEIAVNGPAQVPIYGTYDWDKTSKAVKALKAELKDADDEELVDDAEAKAKKAADLERKREEEANRKVMGEDDDKPLKEGDKGFVGPPKPTQLPADDDEPLPDVPGSKLKGR